MNRAVAVATALLLSASVAHADQAQLAQAELAVEEIDYEAARALVGQALDGGGLAVSDLGRAYRLAGEIAAALDVPDEARDHFLRWILIDPAARLPAGSSPKIARPFAAAQAEAARLGAMSVVARATRRGAVIVVELTTTDPLGMITAVRVRGAGSEARATGTRVELEVAETGPVELRVSALDARGNELASRRVTTSDAGVAVTTDAPATTRARRWPTPVRWPTWTVLGALSAAAGGYFAWRVGQAEDELAALNAASEAHTFDEARAIQQRGDRDATIASAALGVAAAAATVAVLTFVLEPDGHEVAVAPAGLGVTASLRF